MTRYTAVDVPTVEQQLGEPAFEILEYLLSADLGTEKAEDLLTAFEKLLARNLRGMSPELAAEVEAGLAKQRAAAKALAETTGLEWKSWTTGHYVVAFDGTRIGSVAPATTRSAGGGQGRKVLSWRPAVDASTCTLPTEKTVKEAAQAVLVAKYPAAGPPVG
jgi:hypothetical protein